MQLKTDSQKFIELHNLADKVDAHRTEYNINRNLPFPYSNTNFWVWVYGIFFLAIWIGLSTCYNWVGHSQYGVSYA